MYSYLWCFFESGRLDAGIWLILERSRWLVCRRHVNSWRLAIISTCAKHIVIITNSFIHSGHFYSAPSSLLLLRVAPDYSTDTVSEFHAEAHRQLYVKDLPKVPTWRLERQSNPRPSSWKSSSQPKRHLVPQWSPLSSLQQQQQQQQQH